MKNFVLLSALLLLPLTAQGFGYPAALEQGSPMPGMDAVSHGFGGVLSVNVGGMNLFSNPAELTKSNPIISASIGPLILKQSVDDGLGKHSLTYAGLGASSFQAGLNTHSASFALGIAKIRDYTYKGEYFFIDTNPDPVIAGFENLIVSGGVWEAAAGVASVISGEISLGASAGYRVGDINYEYYWHHFNEAIPDSSSEWSREEGEFTWRAGASVPAGNNISIGAVYASKTDNCPSSIAAGVCVGNIAAFSPGFGLEARIYDTEINRAWSANFFGGIHPDHNLFFRGAAVLSSSGGNDPDIALGICMGATVSLERIDISAAFNYGSETRDGNVLGFPDAKTIDDVVTAFTVGASIGL
ncbi:MAG: hypothetical protein KAR40_11735 [Candidatus Sabulitectum sp.]|nr:hypothetical protein [Candidatus Sabulitectum sp.]